MSRTMQLNYDELQRIAQSLQSESEVVSRLHAGTREKMYGMRGSGWVGDAANAFFKEMEGNLLPATQKTARALDTSGQVLNQIMRIIQDADQETATYFKGIESIVNLPAKPKPIWKKIIDIVLDLPVDKILPNLKFIKQMPIISFFWGVYDDRVDGDSWMKSIFSEFFETVINAGAAVVFYPYYFAYPLVIAWLNIVSLQTELTGRASWEAEGIFEIAKYFDPSLTEADQAVWFEKAADEINFPDKFGDIMYDNLAKYVEANRPGPFIVPDMGFKSPVNIFPNAPVAF